MGVETAPPLAFRRPNQTDRMRGAAEDVFESKKAGVHRLHFEVYTVAAGSMQRCVGRQVKPQK